MSGCYSKLFRQVIKESASRQSAALLTMIALLLTSLASASQEKPLDFDAIKLPTDLVAAVVRVEDDIVLSNLVGGEESDSSGQIYSSNTDTGDVAIQVAEAEPASTVAEQDPPQQDTEKSAKSGAGSIFDDVVDGPEIAVVQEPESEIELAVADQQPEAVSVSVADSPAPTPDPEQDKAELLPTAVQDTPADDPVDVPTLASAAPVTAVSDEDQLAINEDEIILGWATAWSNNDVESYLGYYAADFKPSEDGVDLETWKAERRLRLQNQDIRIIVSNAELVEMVGNEAEVHFTQRYTSKSYKDRVIKSIRMRQTSDGWKFLTEQTVEKLPFE